MRARAAGGNERVARALRRPWRGGHAWGFARVGCSRDGCAAAAAGGGYFKRCFARRLAWGGGCGREAARCWGGGVHALLCDHEWAANGGLHAPLHWGGLFAGVCAVLRRGGLLAGGLQPLLAAKGGGCIPCCTVVGAAGGRLYAPLHWGVLLAGFCTWMRLRAPFCKWGFAHLIAEGGLQAGVCMRDCMGVVQVGVCTWEFA